MKAVDFKDVNLRIAENQEEYETLPVYVNRNHASTPTTMCFELSEKEKKQVAETGKIWLTVLTFGNNFHPIRMSCLMPAEFYMKVFKIFPDDCQDGVFYAFSGKDENEAINAFLEMHGETKINSVQEIPKEEWDNHIIKVYEDNDTENAPFKLSINECLEGDEPTFIYTNDPE